MANLRKTIKNLPCDAVIVSKAVMNAARKLRITNVELAEVLGISEPTLSRIANRKTKTSLRGKSFELSLLFIRLFRSLDAIMAGNEVSAAAWLRNNNLAIGYPPIERIQHVEGLIDVLTYLDSRRAIV